MVHNHSDHCNGCTQDEAFPRTASDARFRISQDLKIRWQFESPVVAISSYRCCKQDPARGGEEAQPGHIITFPRTGAFVMHLGRRSIVADSNHILFINHLQPYSTSHPFGCGDGGSAFVLRPDLLLEIMRAHDPTVDDRPEQPFLAHDGPSDARAYLLQRLIVRHTGTAGGCDPLAVEELSVALVAHVVGASCEHHGRLARLPGLATYDSTARAHADWVAAVKGLLARSFHERLSLDDVARAVHCSPYHLARLFKHHTGLSIHRYLNRMRLRASLEQIIDTQTDLATLAVELGFCSHSHFSEAFRREFGLPPSRLREDVTSSRLREMGAALVR